MQFLYCGELPRLRKVSNVAVTVQLAWYHEERQAKGAAQGQLALMTLGYKPSALGLRQQGTGVTTLPSMHRSGHCSSHLTAAAVHACLLMWLPLQAEVVLITMPKSQQRKIATSCTGDCRSLLCSGGCGWQPSRTRRVETQRQDTLLLP